MRKLSLFVSAQLSILLLLGGFLAVQAQSTDYTTRIPVGTLQMFVSNIPDISTGWIPADGRAIDPLDFPELYALLGCSFGCEDANFRVPNLISRVPVGAGADCAPPCLTGRFLGETWGEETHTLSIGELPAHNHGITDPGHSHGITDPGHVHTIRIGTGAGTGGLAVGTTNNANPTVNRDALNSATTGITVNSATTGITTNNTGSGTAFEMWQPSVAVNFAVWGGLPSAPAEDVIITVVVVFPTHTTTPTATATITPTEGPSPTPTATATPTGVPGYQTIHLVGDQEVLLTNEVKPVDLIVVGFMALFLVLAVGVSAFYLRRTK